MLNPGILLEDFCTIARNPKAELEAQLAAGRKVVGCMPYFCPEELVYASGMLPFGLWGAELQAAESKRYMPAFICSLLHTTLELGIRGEYDGLTAVMIPILCDSLKGMEANWRYGVKTVPVIDVAHAQNRMTPAGIEFTASQYRKIRTQLEELSGNAISDEAIAKSVTVYNRHRTVMRHFLDTAAHMLKPSQRNAVIKSSYFMDIAEHTDRVIALLTALEKLPPAAPTGPRIVTTGIIADSTGLLKLLDEMNISIAADQVTHESLRFRADVPVTGDPIVGLAQYIGAIEGCSVLYDPGKRRGTMLAELAKEKNADGVLFVQTKFCDPEEYDYVPIKRMLDAAGIRSLLVEVDQQTASYEQTRTALETFCELLV